MPSSPRRPLPFTVTQKDEEKKSECLMSALGQKRTFAVQNVMSALPPKADMCGAKSDVRLVPKADISEQQPPTP